MALFKKLKMRKLLSTIFISLFFLSNHSFAQVSGDYGAYISGNWSTASIWKIYNGVSWASSPIAGASPNSTATNVFIIAGSTVTITTSPWTVNNLTVEATAKVYTNISGSNYYIRVYGNITCNGIIGNGATFDGISFEIEGANCLFTGTGAVDISRMRKAAIANATTNLTIDININIRFGTGSQTQLYNGCVGGDFNVIINVGKTVNLTGGGGFVGNICIDGLDGSNGTEAGGTFTVNGTLLVSGILYLTTDNSTRACTFSVGATGVITTASVIGNNSGVAKHTLNMSSGSLLQITLSASSAAQFLFTTNNLYNLSAGSTIEYSGAAAQYVESSITYANLKLSGGTNKTALGVLNILGNLDIITIPTQLIPYAANPFIYIGGNWTDYGSSGFLETNSSVIFNGTIDQTLTSSGGEDFWNLKVNKSGGRVVLSSAPATIARIITLLDLTSGNILSSTTAANAVPGLAGTYYPLIKNTATVINTSNISFVEGICAREAVSASTINFTFPVGKSGRYRPISVNGTPTANFNLFSEFYLFDPNSIGAVTSKAATLDHISRCEVWRLRTFGVTGQTFFVTLSWPTYSNCFIVNNLPNLRVTSWNLPTAALWNDDGNGGTTGTTAAGTIVTPATFTFSTAASVSFTLASIDVTNPLPIDLISFEAKTNKDRVELNWATATEINNDYFTIERSKDGFDFEEIFKKSGNGTTSQTSEYEAFDDKPFQGISYYRLRQTDFDGKTTVSEPVAVEFIDDLQSLLLAPNPGKENVKAFIPLSFSGKAILKFADIQGRIIKSMEINRESGNIVDFSIADLPVGVYSVSLDNGMRSLRTLFVKQ